MLKQLAESEIETFRKIIQDIKNDLKEGIFLKNIDSHWTGKLVKILLSKFN